MNVIDWLTHTARWMHADRPDLYLSVDDAFDDLSTVHDKLSLRDGSSWTSWGGFFLHKWEEDGVVEWNLMKKISSADVFLDENAVNVTGWTDTSGTMSVGVLIPGPDLDLGDVL